MRGLCLLLTIQTFVSTGCGLPAVENLAGKPPVPVVWTLDNVTSIGGHKPKVLGKPKVLDAAAGRPSLQFNGQTDGVLLPVNPLRCWAKFTIEVLFRPETGGEAAQRFFHVQDAGSSRTLLEIRLTTEGQWALDTFLQSGTNGLSLLDRTKLHPAGQWHWVALRYDGHQMTSFVNGQKELEDSVAFAPMGSKGQTSLGVRLNKVYWFKGCIKEVRFTPAALESGALRQVSK